MNHNNLNMFFFRHIPFLWDGCKGSERFSPSTRCKVYSPTAWVGKIALERGWNWGVCRWGNRYGSYLCAIWKEQAWQVFHENWWKFNLKETWECSWTMQSDFITCPNRTYVYGPHLIRYLECQGNWSIKDYRWVMWYLEILGDKVYFYPWKWNFLEVDLRRKSEYLLT